MSRQLNTMLLAQEFSPLSTEMIFQIRLVSNIMSYIYINMYMDV